MPWLFVFAKSRFSQNAAHINLINDEVAFDLFFELKQRIIHVNCIFFFIYRLKNFLQESSSVLGGDILNLLYPVFVHMYIELLNNGHKTPGESFISRPEEELGFNENLILKMDCFQFENTRHCNLVGSMSASQAAVPRSTLSSGTFFRGKKFPSSADTRRASCQLLAKEWSLDTGKLPPGGLLRNSDLSCLPWM